jgi:hypothetical protein
MCLTAVSYLTQSESVFTKITDSGVIMIRVFVLVVAALVLPVGLAACSEDKTPADHTPSGSATPSEAASTTPAPEDMADPQQAAIAAFERFMDVFVAANAVPDPDYPGLAEAASGEALDVIVTAVQSNLDLGQRTEGQPEILDITVKESSLNTDPVQVALETCQDSTGWVLVDTATGESVPGDENGRRHIEALVERIDGHWYVTDLAVREAGSCLPRPPKQHASR